MGLSTIYQLIAREIRNARTLDEGATFLKHFLEASEKARSEISEWQRKTVCSKCSVKLYGKEKP